MEDEQIRSQMMVLDHFALFVPRVFSQQSAATEGHPLNEEVERFTFVRCCLNRPPKFDVGYVGAYSP
jgi:hypothetical protein